jgi:asparagine synthase (glutamine-hydrolysing)
MFDEPFADSSQIPTFLVSKLARQQVTVALSGDGGDELFAGYRRYFRWRQVWAMLSKVPPRLRMLAAAAMNRLSDSQWNALLTPIAPLIGRSAGQVRVGQQVRKLATLFTLSSQDALYEWFLSQWHDPRALMTDLSMFPTLFPIEARRLELPAYFNRMMQIDILNYLPDDILVKVDRLSMLVSLEVRAPLLDHRVVEFSFGRVPARLKVNGAGKVLLKQVARRILPAELNVDRKSGFGIPLRAWLGEHDGELMDVLPAGLPRLFNPNSVEAVIRAGGRGLAKRDRHIFALLVLGLWSQAYGGLS